MSLCLHLIEWNSLEWASHQRILHWMLEYHFLWTTFQWLSELHRKVISRWQLATWGLFRHMYLVDLFSPFVWPDNYIYRYRYWYRYWSWCCIDIDINIYQLATAVLFRRLEGRCVTGWLIWSLCLCRQSSPLSRGPSVVCRFYRNLMVYLSKLTGWDCFQLIKETATRYPSIQIGS